MFPAARCWNSVSPIDYSSISLDHLGFNNMPTTGSVAMPSAFYIPLRSFSWCYIDAFIRCKPYVPSPPFPIPVLLFTKPINTCNQLLSNDIWRMWQVNIFCHFTALLGNWLILHKGFSELYDEGPHESRPCTYCCCESSLNKHRLLI